MELFVDLYRLEGIVSLVKSGWQRILVTDETDIADGLCINV